MALLTIALKTLAWHVTGSVGLLSDAMESFVNLASAVFALIMVTVAEQPPDDNHPYGHHKAEYFSSGFEGILIIGAALGILWASGQRLMHPQPLEQLDWGLGLSVLSSVLNGGLAWVMFRAARQHRSIALEADARHLVTDVWTSAGVVVGLLVASVTGWLWLDALVGMGVALNIMREGAELLWRSSQGLMDEAAGEEALADILQTLTRFEHRRHGVPTVRFDHIITRKAGPKLFVELHMHVPGNWTLSHAAVLRGEVEQALMDALPGLRPVIELLPSDVETHVAGEDA